MVLFVSCTDNSKANQEHQLHVEKCITKGVVNSIRPKKKFLDVYDIHVDINIVDPNGEIQNVEMVFENTDLIKVRMYNSNDSVYACFDCNSGDILEIKQFYKVPQHSSHSPYYNPDVVTDFCN